MSIFSKANKILLPLLALFIAGLLFACGSLIPATNPPDRVDVVYFHLGEACNCVDPTGELIYSTIWLNFKDELASGKLTFQKININDEYNATIAEKYNATPFSMFINIVREDTEHIIAVPEIASLTYDYEAFQELVKSKIEQCLKGQELTE